MAQEENESHPVIARDLETIRAAHKKLQAKETTLENRIELCEGLLRLAIMALRGAEDDE